MEYEREIKCVICDRDDTRILVEHDGYRIVRCNACGLIYQNPRNRVEQHVKSYDSETYGFRGKYRYSEGFSLDNIEARDAHQWRATADRLFELVRGRAKERRGEERKPRLLDVGCSYGHLLYFSEKKGFMVTGIDVSPAMVNYVSHNLGLPAVVTSLEEAPFEREAFDVVAARHVFEHILHPIGFLRKARDIVGADGLLYLELPNVQGWDFLAKRWLSRLGLKRKLGFWHFSGHYFHYSPCTLRKLLERTGWKMMECRTYANRNKHTALGYALLTAFHRILRFGNKMYVVAEPSGANAAS
jgi:SAM-dependent methyltransferase